jgi:hypothetical protein
MFPNRVSQRRGSAHLLKPSATETGTSLARALSICLALLNVLLLCLSFLQWASHTVSLWSLVWL